MKLSMPTVKGYGNAMRVHGMYGGIRQKGPVKFGGLRQRGPVQFGGMKRRRRRGMARPGYFSQQVPMNSYSFAYGRTNSKKRRIKRGRGFLDTLKNIGSKALNIAKSVPIASTALGFMGPKFAPAAGVARSLGFARRRRVRRAGARRRVRRGRGLLSSLLGMTGLARRRRRRVGMARRRVRRGRGFLDTLKNIGSKALNIARSVPIASSALGLMGPKFAPAAGVARSLGFARRRRVRRRVGMARRRVRRGRGLLSSLLSMTGLARKRRVRRGKAKRRVRRVKRGGMRKRRVGYRRLLNVPHF
jgi:hypothetical protein